MTKQSKSNPSALRTTHDRLVKELDTAAKALEAATTVDPQPHLPLSQSPGFIPLPANPADLTDEQVAAVFADGDVQGVLREILRLGLEGAQQEAPESAGVA